MKQILWFRRDLRIEDNPLLSIKGSVLPIFIFDTTILERLEKEDKRVSFIFARVMELKKSLKKRGLDLFIYHAKPEEVFTALKKEGFERVYASGDYDSYAKERDEKIAKIISFKLLSDTYIYHPKEILKQSGDPYQVFTPFYKKSKEIYTASHSKEHLPTSQTLLYASIKEIDSIESIGFLKQEIPYVSPQEKLALFKEKIHEYKSERDFFDRVRTSRLSVDLRFGTISIREVLRTLISYKKEGLETEPFFRELIFREFYAYLLFHFPSLETEDFKPRHYYRDDPHAYEAFITAKTGVPIIDASLKELIETGEMHNRGRMITASFFTKQLGLDWRVGEAFFAKHLLDYDKASNVLSWQWSASTGIDPQPYFRILNPYTQAKTYDPEATYIKRHLPELRHLSPKEIHNESFLGANNVSNYPKPIVSQKKARETFLFMMKQKDTTHLD